MKENKGGVRQDGRELRKGSTQEAYGRCQERGHIQPCCCVTSGAESLTAHWIEQLAVCIQCHMNKAASIKVRIHIVKD